MTGDYHPTGGSPPRTRIRLVNQTGQTINSLGSSQTVYPSFQGDSDPNGQVIFPNVPVAQYSYLVQANGYYAQAGTVNAMAIGGDPASGGGTQVAIQLESDPFTYTWTVAETTITDTYAMTVEVTYEAEVPEPSLFVSPLLFCPGESPQVVVANLGPITMSNVTLSPSHDGIIFSGGGNIGTLAPGAVYTGTLDTDSSSTEGSSQGTLAVTATYGSNNTPYQTASQTQKLCVPPPGGGSPSSGGGWTWTPRPNGQPGVIGTYQGSQPSFPSASTTPPATPTDAPERARLVLSGNATLERQAFLASLELTNLGPVPIEDIRVDIEAKNVYSQGIVGAFAVTPTVPTLLGTLAGEGDTLSQTWTLIPGELGITNPEGEIYNLWAQIVYTYNGVVFTTTTQPVPVTGLPQPRLRLSSLATSEKPASAQVKVHPIQISQTLKRIQSETL